MRRQRCMIEASIKDPIMRAGQIGGLIALDVSYELVRQRLRKAAPKTQRSAQKPLHSGDVKARRLAFAHAYVHWIMNNCRNVVFTTE